MSRRIGDHELTVKQREALVLRRRGLRWRDIAAVIGISESVAKRRYYRAMRHLRAAEQRRQWQERGA